MQYRYSENLKELEEDLLTAVLEEVPAERRLRGLPPEDRLRGLTPEDRLAGLSEAEAAELRELLERKQGR
jgi:hypothetical protein